LTEGDQRFLRASEQRAWKGDAYGQVLEEVYQSPREYRILFLGRAELVSEDGRALRAGGHQPLFHVDYSVGGTDTQPLNLWRIVHLTPEKDDALPGDRSRPLRTYCGSSSQSTSNGSSGEN
jgi:hypothetical protein